MKIPYKKLLIISFLVVVCLLIWNAIFEDTPFVWTWHYVFNAYIFPIVVSFAGIFLILLIIYLLIMVIDKIAQLIKK